MDGLQNVIKCYYNCIKSGKMSIEDVPERYRERVEIYYNEVERVNSGFYKAGT